MDEKTITALEFDKIRVMLSAHAVSANGKEAALNAEPESDSQSVRELLAQTNQAFQMLLDGAAPIQGHRSVVPVLPRIKVQAVLSMDELLRAASFLRAVGHAYDCGEKTGAEGQVKELLSLLVPMQDIVASIERSILSDTEMADTASARLASIRRQILQQNEGVKEKLNQLVRNLDKDGVLQEAIVTMRDDRYCLSVIAAHKGRVPGVVHDQSASGATLFIEPMAVVEINNRIRQLKLDERDEMIHILTDLSQSLSSRYDALCSDVELMTCLDLIFAKAKLAREMRAVCPEIDEKGYLDIKQGRHPLIDTKKVVPISVWLGKSFTQLLVTGPNTGGKTVSLKTIGLFALMTQTGLFLPAEPGTRMPVFDHIFVDIGDEQSIQQNLSTFSAHMKNIAEIMKNLTPDSLVLLDELGAGTDPAEGAALAMSILEELRRRRIRTVITSHYAELKSYSLSHVGSENASVEFDVASLRPTYKLMVGVPGNSNAFLISAKLGLAQYLIDRARSYVDEDAKKLDKVLSNAEEYREKAQASRDEADKLRQEINRQKREMERERHEWEHQKENILLSARKEAEALVQKAKEEADAVVERLKQLEHSQDPSAVFKARELRKQLKKEAPVEEAPASAGAGEAITSFMPGMPVHVNSLNKDGILVDKPSSKGKATVRIGIVQMTVDASELSVSSQKEEKITVSQTVSRAAVFVPLSLDVRGQLADEAVANVDYYLDNAFGHNIGSVTVVHGKGTGALKQAIWDYLRRNKHVRSFRLGAYGEGDAGVTVIELKNQ